MKRPLLIAEARKAKRWSAAQAAERIGLSEQHWRNYEKGARRS